MLMEQRWHRNIEHPNFRTPGFSKVEPPEAACGCLDLLESSSPKTNGWVLNNVLYVTPGNMYVNCFFDMDPEEKTSVLYATQTFLGVIAKRRT